MQNTKRVLTARLVESLKRRGVNPRIEVRTAGGVADVVTDTAVYEVVPDLNEQRLREAIERVVACRDAISANLGAVVYGAHGENCGKALEEAYLRGVVVNYWKDGDQLGMQ